MSTYCPTQSLSIKSGQEPLTTRLRHTPRPSIKTVRRSPLSLIGSVGQTILARYAIRRQRRIDREAFLTMLSLDDNLLTDIGVTRAEVRWAASLPLCEDAALALRKSSRDSRP